MARHWGTGMLDRDLMTLLGDEGMDIRGYGSGELDITKAPAVSTTLRRNKPAVVVNCGVTTTVDDAEAHEDAASQANVAGLAAAYADYGAVLVRMSTYYVFSGKSKRPLRETYPPSPKTIYGRGKAILNTATALISYDGLTCGNAPPHERAVADLRPADVQDLEPAQHKCRCRVNLLADGHPGYILRTSMAIS